MLFCLILFDFVLVCFFSFCIRIYNRQTPLFSVQNGGEKVNSRALGVSRAALLGGGGVSKTSKYAGLGTAGQKRQICPGQRL